MTAEAAFYSYEGVQLNPEMFAPSVTTSLEITNLTPSQYETDVGVYSGGDVNVHLVFTVDTLVVGDWAVQPTYKGTTIPTIPQTNQPSTISLSDIFLIAIGIAVAGGPYGGGLEWQAGLDCIAYDSGMGEVFITNYYSGTVSVISDSSNAVVATVNVGVDPYGLVYDAEKSEVFVTDDGSEAVSVISDKSNAVVATVEVGAQLTTEQNSGDQPYRIAYDFGKGEVYVANPESNTVSVISDNNNTVVATVPVGTYPCSVTYDPGKGDIFVINSFSGLSPPTVSVISDNSNQLFANVTVAFEGLPGSLIYDSGKSEIFATNAGDGTVYVISDFSSPSASPSPTVLVFSPAVIILIVVVIVAVILCAVALAYKKSIRTKL
jgi:YVTN family beta-propeller protein